MTRALYCKRFFGGGFWGKDHNLWRYSLKMLTSAVGIVVIDYSLSCCSKPKTVFIHLWSSRTFWPSIDNDMFKAQKGSKEIIKIVHVTKTIVKHWHKRINCWIKLLFLFHLCTKSILIALRLNHWFELCPYNLSGPWTCQFHCCQNALGFHQKYLPLCSEDEQRSYGIGINDMMGG